MIQLRFATVTRSTNPLSLLADPPAWSESAACGPGTAHLFFAPDGERGQRLRDREQEAKALCAGCPVRAECLTYAVDTHQQVGVWGGLTDRELAAMTAAATRDAAETARRAAASRNRAKQRATQTKEQQS